MDEKPGPQDAHTQPEQRHTDAGIAEPAIEQIAATNKTSHTDNKENVIPKSIWSNTSSRIGSWRLRKIYREKRDWGKPTDKAIVFLTLGILIAAVAQTVIFKKQWQEMSAAGKQTDQLIDLYRQQAQASADLANATRNTVKVTEEQMHRSQRAYVVTAFGPHPEPDFEHRVWTPIQFTNVGNTVAKKLNVAVVIHLINKGQDPDFLYAPTHIPHRAYTGVLYPKQTPVTIHFTRQKVGATATAKTAAVPITEEELRLLAKGDLIMAVYGTVTYFDVFKVQHWSTFCAFVGPGEKAPSDKCSEYNNTDDN